MAKAADIAIRPATRADIDAILALVRGLAEYEQLAHECEADAASLAGTLFGKHPAAEVLIAEADGEAAGFALFFHNYSTFLARPGLYLEDLFVWPRFRGLGIGKRLMVQLAQLALARGCGRFEWSVLDWNAPAIGFYRSLGAIGMDAWTVQRVSGEALRRLAGTPPDDGPPDGAP